MPKLGKGTFTFNSPEVTKTDLKIFGTRLDKAALEADVSVTDMSVAINCSRFTASRFVNGKALPNVAVLPKIVAVLKGKATIAELVQGTVLEPLYKPAPKTTVTTITAKPAGTNGTTHKTNGSGHQPMDKPGDSVLSKELQDKVADVGLLHRLIGDRLESYKKITLEITAELEQLHKKSVEALNDIKEQAAKDTTEGKTLADRLREKIAHFHDGVGELLEKAH